MTAEQLPTGYYRIHCRTERALFVGRHINGLLIAQGTRLATCTRFRQMIG